jgi:uncharacterized protein YecA (UPF0149 family)
MIQLLQDGEEASWIIEQIGVKEDDSIAEILDQLAKEISPPLSSEEVLESLPENEEELISDEDGLNVPDLEMKDLESILPAGVDMAQVQDMLSSPRGKLLADFGAFCQEKGIDMEGVEEMNDEMTALQEEWLHTSRPTLDGKKPAEEMNRDELFPRKVETFRRDTPKLGRNEPCHCGSGKKYKKCCGKT